MQFYDFRGLTQTCLSSSLLDTPSSFSWRGDEWGCQVAATVCCVFQRARLSASPCGRSCVPMAVDVRRSPSEASLGGKADGDGRWDCAGVQSGHPELADSLRRLLGTEEAKPCPQGTDGVAASARGHLIDGVTRGGSSDRQEVSSASAHGFPRARGSLSEPEALIYRSDDDIDALCHVGRRFLSSGEPQVRGLHVTGAAASLGGPGRDGDLLVWVVLARTFFLR